MELETLFAIAKPLEVDVRELWVSQKLMEYYDKSKYYKYLQRETVRI